MKAPRAGFSLTGLPDTDTPVCGCIATSGGFERCRHCGAAGRTKKAENMVGGGAPGGFYEFCGHKVVEDSPHRRDHRLDFSLHTTQSCVNRQSVNMLRYGRAKR